jgi:hypothetical protein
VFLSVPKFVNSITAIGSEAGAHSVPTLAPMSLSPADNFTASLAYTDHLSMAAFFSSMTNVEHTFRLSVPASAAKDRHSNDR